MKRFHTSTPGHALRSALFILLIVVLSPLHGQTERDPILAFAILGDGEPKPVAEFPHTQAAVEQINAMTESHHLSFVAGIGDIPHKGTTVQYEAATEVLTQLTLPFFTIMGNEEHGSTVERYLEYLAKWNAGKTDLIKTKYVLEYEELALIFASADIDRDFDDAGVLWIVEQLKQLKDKPVFLFAHAAQAGAYPEKEDKGVKHPGFAEVLARENLVAIISGDLHMDMDRVDHSKQIGHTHYLHIPALERTKIPDESKHTPMFRTITVEADRTVRVDTYEVGVEEPLERHAYRFELPEIK
ncbi:MAG: metallophosphoesterase family protein [Verrucomicrobiota bacterium]